MPQPMKLLIVEDEPAVRKLFFEIFLRMGYDVRIAEDGFSALEQIREDVPDVLLSDLNMPGMSGFELLSVVRRRLPSIYVIATSGAFSGDIVPHGIAADAFYEKATNFRSLLGLMEGASVAQVPMKRKSGPVPIWVSRGDDSSMEQKQVMISCPECLRTFPQGFVEKALTIHDTRCTYCDTPVQYAVVERLDPATSQPYLMQA